MSPHNPKETEAGFQALFESATIGILVVKASGLIHLVNPYIEFTFGYPAHELIGKPVEMLVPATYQKNHAQYLHHYFQNPKPRQMGQGRNLFGVAKSGQEFPLEISLTHYKKDNETLSVAFVTDISERKRAEDELKLKETKYRDLFDGLTELLHIFEVVKDHAGKVSDARFVLVNQATADLFGLKKGELEGKLFSEVLGKMDEHSKRLAERALETGKRIRYERFYPAINRWMAGSFFSPDQKQVVAFAHDITPLKHAEDDLRKLNEGLELKVAERTLELKRSLSREKELNELKSGFVSLASHEFRTPLTTIQTSMSLIEAYASDDNKEKRSKHIAKVKSVVKNMVEMLNDFLSLDKLEQGKAVFIHEQFSANELCEEVKEQMSALLKFGQWMETDLTDEVLVTSDRKILRNVLLNLLSNAIKYSPENKPIRLLLKTTDQHVVFTVSDEGIGIPLQEQKFLFTNFFRASNVGGVEGTGLGLNIVKKYVEMLGGEIRFQSDVGNGSVFEVLIRLAGNFEPH